MDFGAKKAPQKVPLGGPGKNVGAKKSRFAEKAVRAQRFFKAFCGKTAKTWKK
jgi:hypothetical protein